MLRSKPGGDHLGPPPQPSPFQGEGVRPEHMRPFRPDAKVPLDGIRVLDLSRLVAGNMLSLQLADFGAEVIKIEDPRKGDPLRDWRTNNISVHWKVYARNKKSLTLNLRAPEGDRKSTRLNSSHLGIS